MTGTQTFTGLNTFSKVTEFSAGISLDAGGITFPDGTYQSTASVGGGGDVSSVNGHTGDVVTLIYSASAPSNAGTGDIWYESDSGSFYVYVDDGDSLQWVEISGHPGATGATGPSMYIAGFLYDGRGTTLAAGYKSDVIRPVEANSTVSHFGIRSSTAVTGVVRGYIYKVPESYINESGASFEADATEVGFIQLTSGEYGKTGGSVTNSTLNAGDLMFGRLFGGGWQETAQIFVHYEA